MRVQPLAGEIHVIADQPDFFAYLNVPIFQDIRIGSGVLGGVYTAFSCSTLEYVAPVGCDMPFLSAALYRSEIDLLERSGADVVIPESFKGLEPLHAVYRRKSCLYPVENALLSGEKKIISWFEQVNVIILSPSEICSIDPSPHIFFNLNNPDEFQQAEQIAASIYRSGSINIPG